MQQGFQLIDKHKRTLKKLRVSLLDSCNMRCSYCMPDHPTFLPADQLLTNNQIFEICRNLNSFGIDEIRLTGGEPLLRPDFLTIVEKLSTLSLSKLALTTNGIKLKNILPHLVDTKLKYINISLDSLDEKNFFKITKYNGLKNVLDAINSAQQLGFNVKVNTVILRGVNDHEIDDFIKFSRDSGINVRFLEAMKIGTMIKNHNYHLVKSDEIISRLSSTYKLIPIRDSKDSTSINFQLDNGANIGFIASESKSFCGECSRLRLSATGIIYPCLFVDEGPSLKNISLNEYPAILDNIINKKPFERIIKTEKLMYTIGG